MARLTPETLDEMAASIKTDGWCYACHQPISSGDGHTDDCWEAVSRQALDQAAADARTLAGLRKFLDAAKAAPAAPWDTVNDYRRGALDALATLDRLEAETHD